MTQTQTLGCSYEDEEDDKIPWGRLCPTQSTCSSYGVLELINDSITFGRDVTRCDFEISEPQISGIHTKIIKSTSDDIHDNCCASIIDLSTNGTFINKIKIGKNQSRLLFDCDEITFIQYAKRDKKTKTERKKISFIFYKNRLNGFSSNTDLDPNSIYAKYDLRSTLGTGSFAVVKLGISRETGDKYAIKLIDKKKYELKSKSRKKNSIMNEANILQQISHKNIIKVYDVFDENGILYIVLEMAKGGELFSRIIDKKKLNENISRNIMIQLLDAVMYLHKHQIAHRDLKPENILMAAKDSWDIKITDFGLSRLLEYDYEAFTTMCGTPLFLAPEVLSSKKRGGYGFEVDYWSMGVILYLMLVGHPPYNEKDGNLLDLVKNGKYSYPKQTWDKISQSAKDLVQHLMEIDPAKRYNGKQVLKHPWMKGIKYMSSTTINTSSSSAANNSSNITLDAYKSHDNLNMFKSLVSNNNNNKISGKKRKQNDIDDEYKEYENNNYISSQPARKKYKNINGNAKNINLMSMDYDNNNNNNFNSQHSNLTPLDSIIEKNEPLPKINNNQNKKKSNHFAVGDNDLNGNGASSVLKEMSLD